MIQVDAIPKAVADTVESRENVFRGGTVLVLILVALGIRFLVHPRWDGYFTAEFVVAVVLVAGFGALIVRQVRTYVLQYVFFVRFPLFLGGFLVLFPWLGPKFAPTVLGNLFQVRAMGAVFASWLFGLVAYSVVYTGRLIWVSVPVRSRLGYRRRDGDDGLPDDYVWPDPPILTPGFWLAVAVMWLAGSGRLVWDAQLSGFGRAGYPLLGGVLAAAVVVPIYVWQARSSESFDPIGALGAHRFLLGADDSRLSEAYIRRHGRALIVFLATLVGYLVPLLWAPDAVAPVVYTLTLLLALTWLLSFLSFRFDTERIPIFPLLIGFLFVRQAVVPGGYTYELGAMDSDTKPPLVDVLDNAVRDDSILIAVAASGGGIRAALWPTTVLKVLDERIPEFSDNVALVSSVSGGSVGAVFYVNAFSPDGPPRLAEAQAQSGESSLAAITRAIAYCDTWRLFTARWFCDRGTDLERRWTRIMGGEEVTLRHWLDGVREGWRPAIVINTTAQESGAKVVFSNAALGNLIPYDGDGIDLRVTTAARLSASFPLVSPQARSRMEAATPYDLHLVDGGYYDNSGMTTAVQLLDGWLADPDREKRPLKVALVEIDSSSPVQDPIPSTGDVRNALLGPLETLNNVRGASQRDRVTRSTRLFAQAACSRHPGLAIQRFRFALDADLTLSWHLTEAEKAHIRAFMEPPLGSAMGEDAAMGGTGAHAVQRNRNLAEADRLASFLASPFPDPTPGGGCEL